MHHRVRSDWARDWNDAIHAKGCTSEHSLLLSFYLVEILDDKHRKIFHIYMDMTYKHLTIAALPRVFDIAADKFR